jgi:hypothetical protein
MVCGPTVWLNLSKADRKASSRNLGRAVYQSYSPSSRYFFSKIAHRFTDPKVSLVARCQLALIPDDKREKGKIRLEHSKDSGCIPEIEISVVWVGYYF